ncbi:MAG: ABC transporter substrate-binding protein [Campylobacterota bacterium]|nr:ABC transporter substrate-binding protein [Campylobacterota bacterium]
MKQVIFIFIIIVIGIFFLVLDNDSGEMQTKKRVAFVSLSYVDDNTFNGFKAQMKKYGWDENENIEYIVLGAAVKAENLYDIVNSVIKKNPDLILVASTPATQEVKRQTTNKDIPIVFCPVNDPVGANIVVNPHMPEGDITGIRLPIGDIKRFEWLHTIVPSVKTVLVPYTPDDDASIVSRKNIKKIAKLVDIKIIEKPLDEDMSLEQFISTIPEIEAVFLPRDSRIEVRIEDFVKFALERKLPLSVPSYQQVERGGLFTFGFIHTELGADAAKMVDKILQGVKPADLPIKFGTAYLVLNEKTAQTIGVRFPKSAIRNAKMIIK